MIKIIEGPNKILATVCDPCGEEDVSTICNELMAVAVSVKDRCAGLSANQIGHNKRVIVVKRGQKFCIYIDPEIMEMKGEKVSTEGCLSWPGRKSRVRRAITIKVRGRNKRKPHTLNGLACIAFQHEVDHLDGKSI